MPYHISENTKKGCLYLLKHDLEFFSQIVPLLKPEYFDFPAYKNVFLGIRNYYEKYRKIPSDAVLVDFIEATVSGATDDGIDYENTILEINTIDKSCLDDREFILDAIEGFARNKAMDQAIRKSMAIILDEGDIAQVEELVKEALLINRNVDVGQDYFEEVNARLKRAYEDKTKDKIPTILPTHNRFLEGGLSPKELAIVVAPPGVGKSLYLVNQGARCIYEGKNVLYVSLEMSQDKIAGRFDSVLTEIRNSVLKSPKAQLTLQGRLSEVQKKTNGRLIIKEFPTGASNVNQLRSLLVQLKLHKNFTPDVIIVDYLELLRPNRIIDSEYQAQQRIAEELRGLAVEYNALLWTASQTNRQARRVNIITDAELGDSYGKIRPADWVISLNQTQEEYDEGAMRVYVMKARDSKQHYLVNVSVDYGTLQIKEPTSEGMQAEQ
jgi:KaiC/GvpD/RAD55 family RecA-like ATPase